MIYAIHQNKTFSALWYEDVLITGVLALACFLILKTVYLRIDLLIQILA